MTSPLTHLVVATALVTSLQVTGCKGDHSLRPATSAARSDAAQPVEAPSKSIGFEEIGASVGAINQRRWDAAAAIYADAASWTAAGQTQPVVGRDAVVSIWKDLVGWFPDLEVVPTRITQLAGGFLVESWVGGAAGKGVEPLGFRAGARLGVRAAEWLSVRDRHVVEVRSWGASSALREQLSGKAEPVARPKQASPQLVRGAAGAARVDQAKKALGLEAVDWAESAGDLVALAHGGVLWVVTLDAAGGVADKAVYGGAAAAAE